MLARPMELKSYENNYHSIIYSFSCYRILQLSNLLPASWWGFMPLNKNLFVNLSNMTDEKITDISNLIENWMKKNKDNSYVEILGNIWLRRLMNRF